MKKYEFIGWGRNLRRTRLEIEAKNLKEARKIGIKAFRAEHRMKPDETLVERI
jgi:hypothetical protein